MGDPTPRVRPVLDAVRVARPGPTDPGDAPEQVLADKAYSSKANRVWLRRHGIRATIPVRADQAKHRSRRGRRGGRPPAFDPERYADRHAVECGINKLNQYRAFACRYDKLAVRYAATIHVAVIDGWLKRLA